MRIVKSNKLADIIEVNQRSADAKTDIRIIELGSLGDLIPSDEAEAMRMDLYDRGVRVRQLTNATAFEPWTAVEGFVEACMEIRHIDEKILPIKAEVLIFDDTVAFYRVKPATTVLTVEDTDFAAEQRALFDAVWESAQPLVLGVDGSTK